jgi:hypothetical protein
MDERLRRLGRLAAVGAPADVMRWRYELKRAREGAVLDPVLDCKPPVPHEWGFVGSPAASYGEGLVALRGLCDEDGGLHPFVKGVARPLTFREMIRARIDQFRNEGLGAMWDVGFATCTAIVYQGGTTKFRIVPMSDVLINHVPASFRQSYVPINYDDFGDFEELDSRDEDDAYGRQLSKDEVLRHKGWLAALEGDRSLLREYAGIVFDQVQKRFNGDFAMEFETEHTVRRTHDSGPLPALLRALSCQDVFFRCRCSGIARLDIGGVFARVRALR